MIDHVVLSVRDLEACKRFYTDALRPLGYSIVHDYPDGAAWGTGEGSADTWIAKRGTPSTAVHLAYQVADRATVDAFHEAALAAGGVDNGVPGVRAHYHESYYAAYVLDPDGNNVEAVCHTPE